VESGARRTLAGAAVAIAVWCSSAPALAQVRQFDLPSEEAGKSIPEFARQAQIQIIAPGDQLHGVITPRLKGTYDVYIALDMVLSGTGLRASRLAEGVVTISLLDDLRQKGGREVPSTSKSSTPFLARLFGIFARNASEVRRPAEAPEGSPGVEDVTVSASRISIQGYEAPTPVTVLGAALLEREAKIDIGDAIRDLPAVGGLSPNAPGPTNGHSAQGDAGLDTVNLRNLGDIRTLTLFDGQRVVSSSPIGGGVDLSTIPTSLVERVDIVTGGASAAWGSDAVAGVVNLIVNKRFSGFKGTIGFSDTAKNDHRQFKAEASFGTDFAGTRGHAILSGSYTASPDTVFNIDRDWWNPVTLIPNPAGTIPTYVHRGNFGSAQFTQGGLITASAQGTGTVGVGGVTSLAAANSLRGIQFVGPGTPAPFSFGTLPITNGNCFDCTANKFTGNGPITLVTVPYHNAALFGYLSYKLTDTVQASLELNYGHNYEANATNPRQSNIAVAQDNAYLDPAIGAQMMASGISSFTLGTNNNNNMDTLHPTFKQLADTISTSVVYNNRDLSRVVFTLEGAVGEWSWDAYVQHSQLRVSQYNPNNSLTVNYNNAVDAVRVSAANVGASGLPLGSIVCRSTLTAPANGCQPLNIFGIGNASLAARNYIAPGRIDRSIEDQGKFNLNQDVAAVSGQGTLPWELPAGKVAIAAGAEYRHEQQRNTGDPLNLGVSGAWQVGNYSPYAAQYSVTEGFAEIAAPLLKDGFVQSLDFNAAGRVTSYSTSGTVETWKIGLTSQISDDIKVRATYSTDIRAPSITDLFSPLLLRSTTVTDPKNPASQITVLQGQLGNPDLKPEVAKTVAAGVVLTPTFLDGLTLSLDWYSISIHGAIFTANIAQQVLQQCAAGVQYYCDREVFGAPGLPSAYSGALNLVYIQPLNAAVETTSGLDVQADYATAMLGGVFNAQLFANYNDKRTRTALGVKADCAGALNTTDGSGAACSGLTATPKFRAVLSAGYNYGALSVTGRLRLFGSANLVNSWRSGINVDDNNVPSVGYVDIRTSYRWNDNISIYGNIDNVFNTSPPNVANTMGGSGPSFLYDLLGRRFTIGTRTSF